MKPLKDYVEIIFAVLALAVLQNLAERFHFDLNRAVQALKTAVWPARFQVFPHENLLFDGAHNPECAGVLADALREIYPGEKFDFNGTPYMVYLNYGDYGTEEETVQFIRTEEEYRNLISEAKTNHLDAISKAADIPENYFEAIICSAAEFILNTI